ncbi:hypothetical protein [Actinoplanes sp. NPDC051851]|uniref:hypothetical protein n=1 Tax=Actinoplanes sp. NPDC051851 TaxID=3154753 RepID=UPI003449E36C
MAQSTSVLSGPWRWPLGGLAAIAVGACIMPMSQLSWYLPLAGLGEALLIWISWRESVAARHSVDPARLQARTGRVMRLLAQGSEDAARTELAALLPDLERVLGPDHQLTLGARMLDLRLRGDRGEVPDRVAAMAELIEHQKRVLGPDSEETLASRYQILDWMTEDGDTPEVRAAYTALIGDATRALGAGHSLPLVSRSSLAILRYQAGERDALPELTTVAADMERALGPDDPTTISTRRLLAQWDPAH